MVTSRRSGLYLGTVTGLRVTALDAHPRGAHGCLAPTRVRRCWAFMGGTLLQPSLPGHYRGNVAERQRSLSWGGFAAPGARLEPPGDASVFVTRSLPKTLSATGVAGGHVRDRVLSLHLPPRGDTLEGPPRSKGHRAGRLRLPTPASCAGHGMCSSGLVAALSPWGWHLSPCLCIPSLFPAWVLCVLSVPCVCHGSSVLSPKCPRAGPLRVSCDSRVPGVSVPSCALRASCTLPAT